MRHRHKKCSQDEPLLNHKHLIQLGFQILLLLQVSTEWFKQLFLYQKSTILSPGYSEFSYFCKIMELPHLNKCFLHKGFVDLFYNFWIQKSHHFNCFQFQNLFCPSLQFLDPETSVFLWFLNPENSTISTIFGSRNLLVHIHNFWIEKLQYFSCFLIQKLHHFCNFLIIK